MLKTAVIQTCSGTDPDYNLRQCAKLIAEAAKAQAKFVVLPENFPFMGNKEEDKLMIMEPFGDGPIQAFMSELANKHKLWILAGTIPITSSTAKKIRSASILYGPDGKAFSRYDKIHLFDIKLGDNEQDIYQESTTIEAGMQPVVANTKIGRIGLSICYDLRFPELYRNMLTDNVEIIAVSAAFTTQTGQVHWEYLLRARAIENLCYVVAANQCGTHENGRQTWGHSMIIDPFGHIITELADKPGFACAEIDLASQAKLLSRFPARDHRRLEMPLK